MEMRYDDVAWVRSDSEFEEFRKKVIRPDVFAGITSFMAGKRPASRPKDRATIAGAGAFNICYRMDFTDGFSFLLRFPCPGRCMFPEEKLKAEVAVMRLVKENTDIPVPEVLESGMEGPCDMGPYILMEFTRSVSSATTQLRAPGYTRGDRPFLDPNIDEEKLEGLYGEFAKILLQLSRFSFDKIGCLDQENPREIRKRPLTMNMNELVQLGGYPRKHLPSTPFESTRAYFVNLAETHLMHLMTQRNDAVDSEADCRRKLMVRKILLKFARASHLGLDQSTSKKFQLYCDDLRPSNMLVDENLNVVAVIDWEFTYAAPCEYTCTPPWWLLLETPEDWTSGITDWKNNYEPRLDIFLRAMKRQEDISIRNGVLSESQRLSDQMRENWDNGNFWLCYGMRKSWALDIVWPYLDRKLFGGNEALEDRIALLDSEKRTGLLTEVELQEIKTLTRKKMEMEMEQSQRRKLDEWDEKEK
ncbi:hypothetical protein FQN50_000123 [Emmonsiellopsis sp. PD_5]|nr:hypothetical protein FQN50_000123 [Emmonsiellopsis sp. PD_5]